MRKIINAIAAICLLILGKFLLQGDYIPFLQWWAVVLLLGLIFMPFTSILFSGFHDRGYLFSKVIGIAFTGYLMWLLSSLRWMKFTPKSCVITVVIGLLFNIALIIIMRRKKSTVDLSIGSVINKILDTMMSEELLFFGLFLLFVYIRGFKPEAHGTEKFMDYGFMTSMMRSDYMPPEDFWFSGTNLNYYYVGQYVATFLTKLSFVKVELGYNLMLMMIAALSYVLSYSIGYQLISSYISSNAKKPSRILPGLCGNIAGAAVCLAGNMHYPVYKWLEPAVRKFFGMEASTDKYWFPNATRFIGYHPETNDKTIHEFPSYSFVLGDLHAHVINIIFVLTVLGILLAWMNRRRQTEEKVVLEWKEIFHPTMIMLGFFIGLFHMTNFWDFPIYYVVSGAVILFSNMIVYNFKGKAYWTTALQGLFIMVLSKIICLPFTLKFDQISTNIRIVVAHTPLNQIIILWGLPIVMVLSFLAFMIADYNRKNKEDHSQTNKEHKAIARFMSHLNISDLFVITIGLCAIGLILIPELIYVEDIYSGDYKRANTMFKLTYQAFIMFGISFGYIFIRLLRYGNTKRQRKIAAAGLILFLCSLFYVGNAVNAWYGNIFDRKGYKGIDAAAFMKKDMPDDSLAIDWLNEHVKGRPVVLEANGDSYTDYQRVSVMTGLPTLHGWRTHEWLWKSDTVVLDERAADIKTIYTSTNEGEVRELIRRYNISYIYVGKLEQDKFPDINHTLIKGLGSLEYESNATAEKTYETYIIKVLQ